MRDIFIFFCMFGLAAASLWRPWLMTFTYLYTDLIQPQQLSYYLFQGVPLGLVFAVAAILLWLPDRKKNIRFNIVQGLMAAFAVWFTITSLRAVIQDHQVWFKWDSAWKAVLFGGLFLPMVLSTRRRIEAAICLLVLCVGLVTVSGAMKTLGGGGGYDELKMIVQVNHGLYESSTIGTVGIALVPLILYLYRHSPLVGRNRWTLIAAIGMCASSVLIVIGTEARTGLVCIALLGLMYFIKAKQKVLFAAGAAVALIAAIPVLPASFIDRMSTILHPSAESSAATREAVWRWAFKFVKTHPLGGGFRVNRLSDISITVPSQGGRKSVTIDQKARAFHSSYIEVLAEHGWPGLFLYVGIIGATLVQLGAMMRRYRHAPPEDRWRHDLAQAMFRALAIYAVGGAFVGLSTQTTLYIIVAIGLAHLQVDATRRAGVRTPIVARSARRVPGLGAGMAETRPKLAG